MICVDFCRPVKLIPRIYGGVDARIADYPWQLSLRENNRHVCGASILSVRRALTATHCYDEDETYTVTAGSANKNHYFSNNINVTKFITHPDYNNETFNADIAVLWLERDLVFGPTVRPIRLPNKDEFIEIGTKVKVAGWGETSDGNLSRKLKMIELIIIDNEECDDFFLDVYNNMLCAGSLECIQDTMSGDSGGPLIMGADIQIGVVSWGHFDKWCNTPGVYTRVSYYIDWIKSVS